MASEEDPSISPQQWQIADQYYCHRLKVVCFGHWVLHCERGRLREEEADQIALDYRRFSLFAQALERFKRCSSRQQYLNKLIGLKYRELWRERASLQRWTHTIRERRSFLRKHGQWNELAKLRERGTQFWLFLDNIMGRASDHWGEKQRNRVRTCVHILKERNRRKQILFQRKCFLFRKDVISMFESLSNRKQRRLEEHTRQEESTRFYAFQRRRRALLCWRGFFSRCKQLRALSALCEEHVMERAQKMFFVKMKARRAKKMARLVQMQNYYRISVVSSMTRVMQRLRERATERDFARQRDRAFTRKLPQSLLAKALFTWKESVVLRLRRRSLCALSCFFIKRERQKDLNEVISPEFLVFHLRSRERHLRAKLFVWKDFVFRVRRRALFFAIYSTKKYRFLRCRRYLRLWRARVRVIGREQYSGGELCLSLSISRRRTRLARFHFEKRYLNKAFDCWIERVREWQQQWMGRQVTATLMYKLVRERNSFRLWRNKVHEKKTRRERLYAAKREYAVHKEKETIKRLLFAALDDDGEYGRSISGRASHREYLDRRTLRKSFAAWSALMNERKHAIEQERREKVLFFSSTSSSPSVLLEQISSRLFASPDTTKTVPDEFFPPYQIEQEGKYRDVASTAVHARAPPRVSSIHKMNGDFSLCLPSSEQQMKSAKGSESQIYFAARAPPRRITPIDAAPAHGKTIGGNVHAIHLQAHYVHPPPLEPEPSKIKLPKEKLLLVKEVLGFIQDCNRSMA